MGTFKSAGAKKPAPPATPRAGWPCIVIVVLGLLGLFTLLFLVLKYAS